MLAVFLFMVLKMRHNYGVAGQAGILNGIRKLKRDRLELGSAREVTIVGWMRVVGSRVEWRKSWLGFLRLKCK
jgi:hypothetical protein